MREEIVILSPRGEGMAHPPTLPRLFFFPVVDMFFADLSALSPPWSPPSAPPTTFVKAVAKVLRIGGVTSPPPGILCKTTDPNVLVKKESRGTIAYRKDGSQIGFLLPGVHYKLISE
jgi:hypothetical protein